MAEEEQGFTFVDKRRTQAEPAVAAPEENPSLPGEDANFGPEESGHKPDGESQGAPDVYSVVGYCLNILNAEAWQKLGLIADPQTGETSADLVQAKVAIDAVGSLAGLLDSAPQDYFPDAARRDLRSLINDLRLNYVAQRDRASGA